MKPDIPEDLIEMEAEPKSFKESLSDDTSNLFQMYKTYGKDVRQGKIGNIAKYWLLYLDLIRLQHQIHTAVQTSDFDMTNFNKTNYARYGTWYVQIMKEIDHR